MSNEFNGSIEITAIGVAQPAEVSASYAYGKLDAAWRSAIGYWGLC